MKLLYFAWLRERVGKPEENVDLPADVATVADLIAWLKGRGEEFEYAFEAPELIRVAVDRVHVEHDTAITGAREIAMFPPMTGG
ncbi:molybdopterin synthase sulfur carrier subunit [Rhodobium orientis]|uniref:Molybdopterin converting factor subunit 1 n=1 Tax=Rhodobium orientis TaxID=34017 RepID=A0A327JWX5_9HYPH|nr:molybdopterin converting factor subunit 1 [Rhodobium orientis]MBB4301163.1 molybdopterin synthase sulfur carrier subunit [Rhodobium orientis]MBK5949826.1 molybdopterin converting factor subunit 1 [Rhodobium orientis]RAI30065.1 molybdopterin converting factor subunit 1 [Rhodobium orientis]